MLRKDYFAGLDGSRWNRNWFNHVMYDDGGGGGGVVFLITLFVFLRVCQQNFEF